MDRVERAFLLARYPGYEASKMFHVEHFAVRAWFISKLPFWDSGRDAAGLSRNGNEPESDGISALPGDGRVLTCATRTCPYSCVESLWITSSLSSW